MEENMRTRTRLLLSAAAAGLLLTGASAQTTRDEQPRAGNQTRSQDVRPQGSQAERIQDPNRQQAAPQSSAPAPGSTQAQPQPAQQAQPQPNQSQQRTQQSQPPQGTQTTAPAAQATGQNQQPAASGQATRNNGTAASPPNSQSGTTGQAPAASAPQNRQPATTAQQPAQSQPQRPAQTQSQQSGQSQPQQPAQSSQPQQTQSRPAQNNAAPGAQQRSTGVVALSRQQQSEIGRTITRHNVRPLTNVNFSIAVGTRVPRSVTLRALPTDLVTFVPQYRGYSYFVVEEQIVIVEPSSQEIVSIVPYASTRKTVTSKTAPGGKAMTSRPVKLNTEQRDVVRKHATRRVSTERQEPVGVRKRYQPGDRVDREVTIETFPETVYTEVPSIRRHRYFRDEDDVFLVDPDEDRVVDVIR
jgi:hypothetical protein